MSAAGRRAAAFLLLVGLTWFARCEACAGLGRRITYDVFQNRFDDETCPCCRGLGVRCPDRRRPRLAPEPA